MTEHTKEPWRDIVACEDYELRPYLIYSGATPVAAIIREDRGEDEANAGRIVACINACAGIPTAVLEALPPGDYARLLTLASEAAVAAQSRRGLP